MKQFRFEASEEQQVINQEMSEELREFAALEGCELGECVSILLALTKYPSYISDVLKDALATEVSRIYRHFQEHAEIVTTEETVTRTFRELLWK
jgi:hypothetical protein